ncbi:MAG: hypothetical protein FWB94_05250 [Chitinispirillia bacterium]|nr:hypothetical protein [Chitinispirillia bacterium]
MSKVFYMPAPELNGTWAVGDALPEYKEEVSIFKFTVADNGKSASFAVCDDVAACRQALTGLRRGWMMVVCEAAMFAPASTKTISTTRQGAVDLQTEDGVKIVWKLKDKAAIEFMEEGGTAAGGMAAPVAVEMPPATGTGRVFFLTAPDLNGVWAAANEQPEYKEDSSIFKFAESGDGKTALFSICDDVSACRQALAGLRRGWMMVVCDAAQFAPASTKSIKTTKMGSADKQADGGWKVKDKAAIEFIE